MAGKERIWSEEIKEWRIDMGDFLSEALPSIRLVSIRRYRVWKPPTDVYETDSHIVVKVEIAGMREEDFEISLSNRTLTIAGIRRDPAEKLTYQQMEILYGRFETQVYLPGPVEEDQIEAIYEDGFLKVMLPKARTRKLSVT
ncbi:MAG: Hsp20/alpha crystallin family protein [Chloroflexi bacterium]|nr:MAG: Hsp20/alpha crystallin family protein [Chloroflexota bacterium]HDN81094.1 Hsp20/alpha crystallin family protein [Chloroflexota bacterium]